ncbi:MAG TPA: 2-C-methyl-D-erythritol 2,4-cyclodiphosphate synthase [Tepidisphaeraceae bacterium]|nr:2-C-methyl-D-erythritol 2,4-cyclodiphosphate synthase [Tepidisphaeraceae bacterium]
MSDARPAPAFRIGMGHDIHRLRPGGKLVVAGVTVSEEMSAVAHSDGDVAIHALVDALLGAIGAGDIGEHFPNTDPRWRHAASRVFLDHAIALVRDAGWVVGNVDLLILAERPKLQPFKLQMKQTIEAIVRAPVNIKAGTNEGCDAVGRGEAIAASAVVLLIGGS